MPNWGAFVSIIASWCQYFSPRFSRAALVSLTKPHYHFAPREPHPSTEAPASVRVADAVQDEEKQSQVPVHFTLLGVRLSRRLLGPPCLPESPGEGQPLRDEEGPHAKQERRCCREEVASGKWALGEPRLRPVGPTRGGLAAPVESEGRHAAPPRRPLESCVGPAQSESPCLTELAATAVAPSRWPLPPHIAGG
jgi:hypothetical protein